MSLEREDMISPELQMRAVSDYCQLCGYEIVRVIEDLDLSGRFWKTRQVDQAIDMVEAGQADVIVVWRWSRVSRNRIDWALAIGRLDAAGGRLESASESFDTTTATGKFARGMLAEFAAFESDRMADIWREVRDRRVSLGLDPWGHNHLGYRKVGDQHVIDKRLGPITADLYRRYGAGESFAELARWLTKRRVRLPNQRLERTFWRPSTLMKMMDRGFAAGFISVDGVLRPGAHQPVISPSEWEQYLARRRASAKPHAVRPESFLLYGLVRCSCGSVMRAHGGNHKRNYRCVNHLGRPPRQVKVINEDRLDGIVFRWLLKVSTDARHASAVQIASRKFAERAAREVRRLTRSISAGDTRDETRLALAEAEADANWRNPAELARALTQDWAITNDAIKRHMIEQAIRQLDVRTKNKHVVVTVHTRWDTQSRVASDHPRPYACVCPRDDLAWMTSRDALTLTRVDRMTLRHWREEGLLPLTRSDDSGSFLYAKSDLDRLMATRRPGGLGVDRRAVKADLGIEPSQSADVMWRPHPANRPCRPLPADLLTRLVASRAVEDSAETLTTRRAAQAATANIMRAAVEAGWLHREVAAAIHMYPQTVQKRVAVARSRAAANTPALVVPGPTTARAKAFKQTPADERDWLTLGEAARYTGRCQRTIMNWREGGLLPNTDETTWSIRVFLRSDLNRVTSGPKWSHGIHYARLRAEMAVVHE